MKAIVYTKYGPPDVLDLQERDAPSPQENEVLIRVRASSVNALDWRQFTMPLIARLIRGGLREPHVTTCGIDTAGQVEAVGSAVTRFRAGDEVFGKTGWHSNRPISRSRRQQPARSSSPFSGATTACSTSERL